MEEIAIAKKLLEHDEQFVQVRSEIGQFRDEVNQRFDEVMVILRRLDQERVFTTEWIKRIDKRVDKRDIDITGIKQKLEID